MSRRFAALHCLAVITFCATNAVFAEPANVDPKSQPLAAGIALASGIEAQYIDSSVRPQDDLYRFVNGKWLDRTEIPADKARIGSFDVRYEESLDQLRDIIEAATRDASAPEGGNARKIGNLYQSFLDEARLETLGATPLAAELGRIAALGDKHEIAELLAHLQEIGVTVPLGPNVHLDNRDSSRYVFDLGQDGLGMPDRDYYLSDDAELKKIRAEYRLHIQRTLSLIGDKTASEEARGGLAPGTEAAKAPWTKGANPATGKV